MAGPESSSHKDAVSGSAVRSHPSMVGTSASTGENLARLSPIRASFHPGTVTEVRGRGQHLFGMVPPKTELRTSDSNAKGPEDVKAYPSLPQDLPPSLPSRPPKPADISSMLRPTPTATIAGSSGPRSWWLSPPPPPPPPTPYEGAASMGALPELPALENPPPLPQAVAAHHPPTTGRSGKTKPMLLSEECQKRGFNPRFHGWIDSQGKTHCSVEVKGVVYKAPRGFNTLPEAKNVAAKRALPVVRKMPMRGARPVATAVEPSDQSRTTTSSAGPTRVKQELRVSRHERSGFSGYRGYKRARVPVKSEPGAGRSPALGDRAERYPRRATHRDGIYLRIKTRVVQDGIAYSQTGNDYDRDRDRDAELHSLIRRVHSLYGSSKGPSTRIMEDSLASRAFLEGMALGTQLGEPARHERRGSDRYRERSRSASPAWSRRRPRSRSPQRSRRIISYRD